MTEDDQCRIAFEKWHSLRWGIPNRIKEMDAYYGLKVDNLWLCWKEAWCQGTGSNKDLEAMMTESDGKIDDFARTVNIGGIGHLLGLAKGDDESEEDFKKRIAARAAAQPKTRDEYNAELFDLLILRSDIAAKRIFAN